jgi:YD repeat-containing protein
MAAAILILQHVPLAAQGTVIETAKPGDTVSPYGVSYTTGSFTYTLPLLEIGEGEWPQRLSLSLNYDSSGNRQPNNAWTINSGTRISIGDLENLSDPQTDPDPGVHRFGYYIVAGNTSIAFEKLAQDRSVGTYLPGTLQGHTLTYEMLPGSQPWYENSPQEGHFTLTSRDGDRFRVYQGCCNQGSGFNGEYTSASGAYGSWANIPNTGNTFEDNVIFTTNRGLAVVIEVAVNNVQRMCAYNLAVVDVNLITDCSQSQQVATLIYGSYAINGHNHILSAQLPDDRIYNFQYVIIHDLAGPNQYGDLLMNPRTRYHLSCVREPGQSACSVQNEYQACDGPGSQGEDLGWTGARDRVARQTLGDGRVITYSYLPASLPCRYITSVTMTEAGASRVVSLHLDNPDQGYSNIRSELDPLGRSTQYQWVGQNSQVGWIRRNGNLGSLITPRGNSVTYQYDNRGNVTEARQRAISGSGLGDIVQSAVFPATCTNPRTCNRPTSMSDARGNTTNYEYDPTHGGLLTETGPPDANGIRPRKRYYYQQRYAWLRNGNSYVRAATPIWLLTSERFCRTSATSGDSCAGGSQDEVVTAYEYGPDSGPNNLWLRGTAVTSEGTTLRTCYSYDGFGRRISETGARAGLTSCP